MFKCIGIYKYRNTHINTYVYMYEYVLYINTNGIVNYTSVGLNNNKHACHDIVVVGRICRILFRVKKQMLKQ